MEKVCLKIPGTVRISACIRNSISVLDDRGVLENFLYFEVSLRGLTPYSAPNLTLSLFSTELHKFTKNDNASDSMKNPTLEIAMKKINKTFMATNGKQSTHFGVISK